MSAQTSTRSVLTSKHGHVIFGVFSGSGCERSQFQDVIMKRTGLRRLGFVTLTASLALLAACSSGTANTAQKGPHQKVTLTWWTWTANPKSVIKNFEKKYPWITIPTPPSYGSGGT